MSRVAQALDAVIAQRGGGADDVAAEAEDGLGRGRVVEQLAELLLTLNAGTADSVGSLRPARDLFTPFVSPHAIEATTPRRCLHAQVPPAPERPALRALPLPEVRPRDPRRQRRVERRGRVRVGRRVGERIGLARGRTRKISLVFAYSVAPSSPQQVGPEQDAAEERPIKYTCITYGGRPPRQKARKRQTPSRRGRRTSSPAPFVRRA